MNKKENIYPYADLVLYNGKIWAGIEKKDESAIAIKNNIIIFVGDDTGVKKLYAPHTKIIDLQGGRVVPGFIDAHAHLLSWSSMLIGSISSYEPQLKEDAGSLVEQLLYFFYGQVYHRLCKFLGITPMDMRMFPMAPRFVIKKRWRRMMDAIIKMGVTSITEAGMFTWREYDLLQEMYSDGELRVRVNILFASRLLDDVIKKGFKTGHGNEWIRFTGIKLYSDGWLTPRTAALLEPYENSTNNRGILFLEYDKARRLVQNAYDHGLRVATHAIGDRAVKTMLYAYKAVLEQAGERIGKMPNELDHRFSIEHATLVPENKTNNLNLRKTMKDLEVTASIQLSFASTDCENITNIIGIDRTNYWNPFKSFLDMKIPCAGGTDYPITTASPLWGIQRIITRADVDGSPVGCNPDQKLTVEEALDLVTRGAAYHSFEDDIKGSIEVGKLADLAVLSDDIIEMGDTERCRKCIHNVDVEMTIIDGKIEYLNPKSSLYPFDSTTSNRKKSPYMFSQYMIIHGFS